MYWGIRHDDIEECTSRLYTLLYSLSELNEDFATWFEQGKSKKSATNNKLVIDKLAILKLLEKGRNYTDIGHIAIEELGFSAGLWMSSAHKMEKGKDSATLSVNCGCSVATIPNSCLIQLPQMSNLLTLPTLKTIMDIVVNAWDPDWGVLYSNLMSPMITRGENEVAVGWMTYLRTDHIGDALIPSPYKVESIGMKGKLILATEEIFTAAKPEHVILISKLKSILKEKDLLKFKHK